LISLSFQPKTCDFFLFTSLQSIGFARHDFNLAKFRANVWTAWSTGRFWTPEHKKHQKRLYGSDYRLTCSSVHCSIKYISSSLWVWFWWEGVVPRASWVGWVGVALLGTTTWTGCISLEYPGCRCIQVHKWPLSKQCASGDEWMNPINSRIDKSIYRCID
jgi:hypothetical protein